MSRSAEEWIEREFGPRIRLLSPGDPQGPTIVWSEAGVYAAGGDHPADLGPLPPMDRFVATQIHHTYVATFCELARPIIEDVALADDAAVHRALIEAGLEPA